MLHLPELVKQGQHTKLLTVKDRLPFFLIAPCEITVSYHVEAKDDCYLIYLKVSGSLTSLCQRCMQDFPTSYENHTVIAVCRTDERAEQMLGLYECIVSTNWLVDLEELIVDELHLYAPQFHPDINDCDSEVNQFLTEKNDSY
ncbi:metal-binding protein [Legionella antarctica]|uniref:Metal-binding protein n=1 Tax=Legionella antarctica TaxID=2708020 RepID=A0A6F8T5U3_9GAMM|nr:metal-binding protein [Legionella antarctica]BCA95336.1 metal-binding protein [Legionella antarctica]